MPAIAQQKDTADPQTVQQIRVLAMKLDEAFNKNDPAALAALYTENAVMTTSDTGTSRGRQAIEKSYAYDFQTWHPYSRVTSVDRVTAVGNEVRSHGRWSDTAQSRGWQEVRNSEGYYSWIIVREGDTWKIRSSTTLSSMAHPGGATW